MTSIKVDIICLAKDQPNKTISIESDVENLERSILHIQSMLSIVSQYVDDVVVSLII